MELILPGLRPRTGRVGGEVGGGLASLSALGLEDEDLARVSFARLEGLDLDDVSDLQPDELEALGSFWSKLKRAASGALKLAAKALGPASGILKFASKGLKILSPGLLQVGKFVLSQPIFRKALMAVAVPFTGPIGPAMLEVAAGMVHKAGKAKVKRAAGEKTAPPPTVGELRNVLRAMRAIGPVRARMVQRMVRVGVDPAIAVQIAAPKKLRDEAQARAAGPRAKKVIDRKAPGAPARAASNGATLPDELPDEQETTEAAGLAGLALAESLGIDPDASYVEGLATSPLA